MHDEGVEKGSRGLSRSSGSDLILSFLSGTFPAEPGEFDLSNPPPKDDRPDAVKPAAVLALPDV